MYQLTILDVESIYLEDIELQNQVTEFTVFDIEKDEELKQRYSSVPSAKWESI